MGIEFQNNQAVFADVASVEDAEGLFEWLQKTPGGTVDLTTCTHIHPANLQLLLAAGTAVKKWPEDTALRSWLETLIPHSALGNPETDCIEPGAK